MSGNAKTVVLGADDVGAVVVDCGSWAIRFGNAGDDSPRVVVPAAAGVKGENGELIGGSAVTNAPMSFNDVSHVYGFDAQTGTAAIRDWDAMRAVWQSALRALGTEENVSPLMIVEPSRAWPSKQRARALELAIEGVGAPAAYVARGSAMTAFTFARTTACVVDVGHQGATAVPVVDGYALQKSTQISAVGGHFLATRLATWADKRLSARKDGDADTVMTDAGGAPANEAPTSADAPAEEGVSVAPTGQLRAAHEVRRNSGGGVAEDLTGTARHKALTSGHQQFFRMRVVDDMKSALLRVEPEVPGGGAQADGDGSGVLPLTAAVREALQRPEKYVLPDGQSLEVGDGSGLGMANALFENHPVDKSQCAISNLAFDAISASDIDSRRDLFGGVILTGGCSLIPGTSERFSRELSVLTPQPYKLKVQSTSSAIERTCAPWIGGSIVASLGTFQSAWVSKHEYEENGAMNALRKCP